MRASTGLPAFALLVPVVAGIVRGRKYSFEMHLMTESQWSAVMHDQHAVGQDAGVVDSYVEAANALNRFFYHGIGAFSVTQGGCVDDSLAAHGANGLHHRLRRRLVVANASSRANHVIDDHLTPCKASISACVRPMPRPAPVTTAIRPSHNFMSNPWNK